MAVYSKILALLNGIPQTLDLADSSNALGVFNLQLLGSTSGYIQHQASATTTSYSLIWPSAQAGGSNYVLTNDGLGNLSWAVAAGTGANTFLSNLSNPVAINQDLLPDATTNNRSIGNSGALWYGVNSKNSFLFGSTSGYIQQSVPAVTTSYSLVWPSAQAASSGYALINDGSGNLSWAPAASALVFSDSLVNNSGTVTLVNDSASPGASQYYGTNGSSVLGYYSLPVSGINQLTGDVTAGPGTGSQAASLVATSNATLTTLSALTTASALAMVGTITSGTWNGTTVAIAHGGTGTTTAPTQYGVIYAASGTAYASTAAGTAGYALVANSGSAPTFQVLGIGGGGTGQTTATAAFGALSPLTTKGDILTYGTSNIRQAVPSDNGALVPDSTQTSGWRSASYLTGLNGKPIKQYIEYADFENNSTTGWTLGTIGTLTNGLPTGTPTFGSGTSGNLSIATTSSSIEGAYSLNYVSSAATTQGDMVASSAYTIDAEDQAKVLTVKFYYKAASGAANCNFSGTSSNSFAWAIYDVTNSSWLTSAGNFNLVQSSGCGYVTGTCQTNATTSQIRLVVYNANATSGAATITLDGFYVGPQTAPMGPAMSDWQTYNLTIGAVTTPPTLGTNTNTAYYRRVGDSLEISYVLSQTSAGTSGSGTYLFPLPSGLSIDTTKVTVSTAAIGAGGNVVGNGQISSTTSANAATAYTGVDVIPYNTTNLQLISAVASAGQTSPVGSAFFGLAGSTIYCSFSALIPIVGWSSNTSMSSDTDTRVVAASVKGLSSATLTSSTAISFSSVTYDTHGVFSSNTYTAPVSGYYRVTFSGLYLSGSTTDIILFKNGAGVIYMGSVTTTTRISVSGTVKCNAGDLLTIRTDSTVTAADATNVYAFFERLSGPAVVAATESVNARYTDTSGGTIGTSAAVYKYQIQSFDSHNAYSTSTGLYTVPVSGKYLVSGALGTAVVAANQIIYIYHNGSAYSAAQTISSGSANYYVSVTDEVNCLAGDTLAIYALSGTSTTAITSAGYNKFVVTRVGN